MRLTAVYFPPSFLLGSCPRVHPHPMPHVSVTCTTCNRIFFPFKDQSQLQNKDKELKKLNDLLVKLEEKSQEDSEAVKAAQDHFHAVSAGLSSNEGGEDKTLADQIMSEFNPFVWF